MSVTRTELLEAPPLEPVRPWRPRVVRMGTIVVALFGLALVFGRQWLPLGWMGMAVAIVYFGMLWWDNRAHMQAKGRVLSVRNHFRTVEVDAEQVRGLKYQFNGRKPDFTLELASGRSVWVPTSRLERGHSTLFAWVRWFAPDAVLDEKAQRYMDHMLAEKLI